MFLIKKIYYVLAILIFSNSIYAQEIKRDTFSYIDGPYVFYKEGKIIVKTLLDEEKTLQIDTLFYKKQKKLRCIDKNNTSFDFFLKDTILIPDYEYKMPKKLITISDIEGNFQAFKTFLVNNKVVDKDLHWQFGKNHLVLNGDFFDRGNEVTQCLWLIYKLEQEAEQQGGKVHFILGNHDIMNMYGSIKYVYKKYTEIASILNKDYKKLYTDKTELGRWIVSKNIVHKIGKYLFVHAGISKKAVDLHLSIEQINNIPRSHYFSVQKSREIQDEKLQFLLSSKESPYWFRGIAKQEVDIKEVEAVLKYYNAHKMVVGHTLVPNITYLYNKKVINIDTDHAKGKTKGLLIQSGKEYSIDIYGKKTKIK